MNVFSDTLIYVIFFLYFGYFSFDFPVVKMKISLVVLKDESVDGSVVKSEFISVLFSDS